MEAEKQITEAAGKATLAERFKIALNRARLENPAKNKKGLADYCGVTAAAVSNWLTGKTKTISYTHAVRAAEYLGVSASWLHDGQGEIRSHSIAAISPEDTETPSKENLIAVPEYEIRFAAGDSTGEPTYEEVNTNAKAFYRREWFEKRHLNPADCRRFKVRGTSMEPLLWDGDTILVDCAPQRIIPGKIYAFSIGGDMRVKALYPLINGGLLVKSVNPGVPDETIPAALADQFRLIGRVRDRAGGGMF